MKKRTKKITQEEAEQYYRAKNMVMLEKYVNMATKIMAVCFCGKEFLSSPRAIFSHYRSYCGCLVSENGWSVYSIKSDSLMPSIEEIYEGLEKIIKTGYVYTELKMPDWGIRTFTRKHKNKNKVSI